MRPSLPLLLKLCAAAAAGAAALLAARRLRRAAAVAALRRRVRSAAASLPAPAPAAPPPPWSSPVGPSPPPRRGGAPSSAAAAAAAGAAARRSVRAVVAAAEEEGEEEEEEEEEEAAAAVELVEAALPEPSRTTRASAEAAVAESGAECAVVALRCGGPCKEREMAVRKLADVAAAVRGRGLHLIVVLTHKKALKTKRQAEELRREVAFRANTDCVFFIENYTLSGASNLRHPAVVKNDFDTDFTILAIVRQCLEFVKLHRSGSTARQKPSAPARTVSHVTLEDPKE
ncbi:hypothetical protein ACMD2_08087 [Ananas comosus]|uniref:Uncharacterized protein n=1 Tax=Ananas comosus TaxID=4615 RepID=A0A199UVB6_ANACO|nr:hypothetical protein ACMD2_08087 [Ananas comosus]